MATHLYTALQGFFRKHWKLAGRPLFITGESYAGEDDQGKGARWKLC
jgi:vitellogenic carboxypeptidase-like protein